MADSNIKKVVIPKENLPSIIGKDFTYNVRYRLISEDKNRTSYWSRIHNISAVYQVPQTDLPYSWIKESTNYPDLTSPPPYTILTKTSIRLNWEIPTTLGINTFDIFVKRDSGAYSYYGTSYTNNYVILRTGTETSIKIIVQAPTYPKEVTASAQLFETVAITVP